MSDKIKNPYSYSGTLSFNGTTHDYDNSVVDPHNYFIAPWKANNAAYESAVKAQEWATERALQLEEREYNSPAAQAQRMREAGINPDLAGVNSDVGSGSISPTSKGVPSTGNGPEILDIISSIPTLFQQGLSIMSSIQNAQSKSFELAQQGNDLIEPAFMSYLGAVDRYHKNLKDFKSGKLDYTRSEFEEHFGMPILDEYAKASVPSYFSNRQKKKYYNNFNRYIQMNRPELERRFEDLKLNRTKTRHEQAKFSGLEDLINESLSIFLGNLYKNELEYKDNILGKQSSSSTLDYNTKSASYKNDAPLRDLMNGLYESYEGGNMFSGVLLALMSQFTDISQYLGKKSSKSSSKSK